jgi:predicted nucleic acid-binding protein
MAYLLDTNTVSEMVAARPDKNVLEWFETQDESRLFLSIITWGELQRAIFQLSAEKRRLRLETWMADDLYPIFGGRIIDVGEEVITVWAKMLAEYKPKGIVRSSLDSLIEATALHHNLILVTRNEKNFRNSHVSVLNPWNA